MRALALSLVVVAGCYSPHPPDGAYLCSAGDQACPSGQHCTCGQCVAHDSAAACSFTLSTGAKDKLDVDEHQQFPLTIQALDKDGNPASGFNGSVSLSAVAGNTTWGDVSPATAPLSGGSATAMVSLNRETLSPAFAVVKASFAGASGSSGGINVHAPNFTVDTNEILPPLTPFGWAKDLAAEAAVTKQGANSYVMYFIGQGGTRSGVGLATSTDGKVFTAAPDPVLTNTVVPVYSPTVYTGAMGTLMAAGVVVPGTTNFIALATSPDEGKTFTPYMNGSPVLSAMSCSYCVDGVTYPQVLPDPSQPVDAGAQPLVMFFSAIQTDPVKNIINVSIDRADSTDGISWTAEPAPLLSSSLSGEQILLSPRVLLDGSVWKMWYSYAAFTDLQTSCSALQPCPTGSTCSTSGTCTPADPQDTQFAFCQQSTRVSIGYATSSDGRFWTKSTANPALAPSMVGLDAHALLVSSAALTPDGTTIWFSTYRKAASQNNRCVPNGIRRAYRP